MCEKFFYRAAWGLSALSTALLPRVVYPLLLEAARQATGEVVADLALDDTTAGRSGKHVAHAEIVPADPLPRSVCEDPKDDVFLAGALAAKTPIIVSGDRHLLEVSGFSGIEVLRPRAFVEAFL